MYYVGIDISKYKHDCSILAHLSIAIFPIQ